MPLSSYAYHILTSDQVQLPAQEMQVLYAEKVRDAGYQIVVHNWYIIKIDSFMVWVSEHHRSITGGPDLSIQPRYQHKHEGCGLPYRCTFTHPDAGAKHIKNQDEENNSDWIFELEVGWTDNM